MGSKFIAGIALLACLTTPAFAENRTLVSGYYGCVTEKLLDEYTSAVVSNDQLALADLEKRGCFGHVRALPYTMVDFGFAVSEIRVYLDDGQSVTLFVPTEATR